MEARRKDKPLPTAIESAVGSLRRGGGKREWGEAFDAYLTRAFGEPESVIVATDAPYDFVALAERVYGPMLAHREESGA